MKRENDEITDLFRSRLTDAEIPVRDGFWEELNEGVTVCHHRRRLIFFRATAAASVLLVLAAASAAFWYFSPKEEIEEAFTQIAVANTGTLSGDAVKQEFKPIQAETILQKPVSHRSARCTQTVDHEDDSTSVTLSMSFSFSMNSSVRQESEEDNRCTDRLWQAKTKQTTDAVEQESPATVLTQVVKHRCWALKAAVGTAFPIGDSNYSMPLTIGVTAERQLNNRLAVESGLQYTHLRAQGKGLHYLGIPLKINIALVDTRKFDLYATVGGILDKCIAGASGNRFKSEPMQLALTAGVGMRYQINDKIALFAEPGVSHHLSTRSELKTIRTEQPTNVNLICGLRMTY